MPSATVARSPDVVFDRISARPSTRDIGDGDFPALASLAESLERVSAAAGTLLTVRPLWQLGLGTWLAARPDLLGDGFGRAMLAEIARQTRAAPDDPIFRMLGEFEPADPYLVRIWRVALDRWLRRRARVKLGAVARKRGWLLRREDALIVRFTVAAADVRLRRQALDLDPGWVDWLGLTVTYRYADEPLE